MHPVFLQLGPITIRWYGVMAALGFLAALFVMNFNRKKAAMNSDQAGTLVFLGVFFGIVGARIFYVVQNWNSFSGSMWEIFRIDHGGLVFYGGVFLAIISMIIYCRLNRLDFIRVFDISCPALMLGHAFGRIGCFLNGCCFGKPAPEFLGVVYPPGSLPALRYSCVPLYPVQLYESAANIVLFIILQSLVNKAKRGQLTAFYFILYGMLRFVDEFFRGDHTDFFLGSLTPAQTIGIILIPLGIGMLIYFTKNDRKKNTI